MGPGPWRLRDLSRDTIVAERVAIADSFWARFRGLMLRPSLAPGEGLYLATTSIHMLFMRFPIDALFVSAPDAEGVRIVRAVRPHLPAWRGIVLPVRGAEAVIELAAGTLARASVEVGDAVHLGPAGA